MVEDGLLLVERDGCWKWVQQSDLERVERDFALENHSATLKLVTHRTDVDTDMIFKVNHGNTRDEDSLNHVDVLTFDPRGVWNTHWMEQDALSDNPILNIPNDKEYEQEAQCIRNYRNTIKNDIMNIMTKV